MAATKILDRAAARSHDHWDYGNFSVASAYVSASHCAAPNNPMKLSGELLRQVGAGANVLCFPVRWCWYGLLLILGAQGVRMIEATLAGNVHLMALFMKIPHH